MGEAVFLKAPFPSNFTMALKVSSLDLTFVFVKENEFEMSSWSWIAITCYFSLALYCEY